MSAFVSSYGDKQSGTASKAYQVAIVIYANWIRQFQHFMSLGMSEREQIGHINAAVVSAIGKRNAVA